MWYIHLGFFGLVLGYFLLLFSLGFFGFFWCGGGRGSLGWATKKIHFAWVLAERIGLVSQPRNLKEGLLQRFSATLGSKHRCINSVSGKVLITVCLYDTYITKGRKGITVGQEFPYTKKFPVQPDAHASSMLQHVLVHDPECGRGEAWTPLIL